MVHDENIPWETFPSGLAVHHSPYAFAAKTENQKEIYR